MAADEGSRTAPRGAGRLQYALRSARRAVAEHPVEGRSEDLAAGGMGPGLSRTLAQGAPSLLRGREPRPPGQPGPAGRAFGSLRPVSGPHVRPGPGDVAR